MFAYMTSKYNSLMEQLANLPDKIAEAEAKERAFINATPDGWAGLGKNDTQRQLAVDTYLGGQLSLLRSQLSAAKYAAELHSSMLAFVAANGFQDAFRELGRNEQDAAVDQSFLEENIPDTDIFAGL